MSLADDPTIIPLRTPPPSESDTITEEDAPPADHGPLPRGATIGRYLVLDEIGVGAMGRVYAAYDPRLDRRVALKLIRGQHAFGARADRAAARLLAEAQALARLAHPNVVGVHDVEIVADSVAIAMEFVDGTTLRGWLATARPWRDVLAALVAAGTGLAAAHRAGIIHRDFKPDNVMLGDDGRARVVDFGLARNDAGASDSGLGAVALGDVETSRSVIATEGIAGTPAYMAPELYEGAAADARSDQFSFCVTLFEALYGRRPFEGTSPATLLANVIAGKVVVPDVRGEVPGWLHRLIVRGLAARPEDRHADMDALLAELGRDPSAGRRRAAIVAAAAVVFAGGLAATWRVARPDDPCASTDAEAAGLWDDAIRERIAGALAATGAPWAQSAHAEIDRRLGAFAAALAEMSRDNCMATHVRHEQSDAMLDRRATCLGARRRELAAATKIFVTADADVAREAVRILDTLGSIEACADLEALGQALPPPDDPDVRGRVDAVREQLADIDVMTRAGKFVEAHRRAEAIADDTRSIDYPPVVAEAQHLLGYLQDKVGDSATAERTLAAAALLAEQHHHDDLAARALADAVFVIGSQLGRVDDALVWSRFADASAARVGDPLLLAKALNVRGMVLETAGQFGEAESVLRAGLDLRVANLGERHIDVSASLVNLAVAVEGQGRDADAIALYERARTIDEELLGPDHPRVASELNNSVSSLLALGRTSEALAAARRAETIYRAALPADHPNLAAVLGNIASALGAAGDFRAARDASAQQLEMNRRRFGDEHPDVALAFHNLAAMEYDLGDLVAAGEHFARAAEIYAAVHGPDHPEIAGSLSGAGQVAQETGDHARARAYFSRAIDVLDRAGLRSRIELPIALRSLARSCLAQDDVVAAEDAVRRALELFATQPQWAHRLSETRWLLARVLHARGARDEALALARDAIDSCTDPEDECGGYRDALASTFGLAQGPP